MIGGSRVALAGGFAALGVTSSLVPAVLPRTAQRLGVPADALLPGVSALFAGLLVAVLLVAFVPRVARGPLLVAGGVVQATGIVIVACAGSPEWFLAACAVAGFGFGLAEAGGSGLARRVEPEHTGALLTRLNVATAVAAAVTPIVIAVVPSGVLPIVVGALALVPLVAAVLSVPGARRPPSAAVVADATPAAAPVSRAVVILGAVALFLFVGAETGLSGWSSVVPLEVAGLAPGLAALGTSAYWILMAAGRAIAAVALHRGIRPQRYLLAAFTVAAAAMVAAIVVGDGAPIARLALIGVGVVAVAPGYAILLGRALTGAGDAVERTAAALIAVGTGGGVLIPLAIALTTGAAVVPLLIAEAVLLVAATVAASWPAPTARVP